VQDNSPIHTGKAVQQKWDEWEAQGLYLFFLPKYFSEMNPIEPEWHQLLPSHQKIAYTIDVENHAR